MKYLFVLGRQPEISIAELRAVLGDKSIGCGKFAIYTADDQIDAALFNRLGSIIKVTEVISDSWNDITDFLPSTGKVTLGFSTYGTRMTPRDLTRIGLDIKKQRGSVRLVPSSETNLSSATVFHNKLARGGNKFELILAECGSQKFLARTIFVQDINAYTFRDRSRPKRDARVGMLPPKLAQTMVNLAVRDTSTDGKTLLDPFCGTGVVLQEAALMGLSVHGTDIEPRMVDFTAANLDWLGRTHHLKFSERLEVGDATSHIWQQPIDYVVCETYLGTPYAAPPTLDKLHENMNTCNIIIEKFLKNISSQIKSGTRLCIAIPAWFIGNQTYHLPVASKIEKFGFSMQPSTADSPSPNLVYHREGQIVGRELLLLHRK